MFDFYLLPIHLSVGRELAELPGLLASAPPKKTARGRGEDSLFALLTLTDGAAIPPSTQQSLLDKLCEVYFATPGTVTAAIRNSVQTLNDMLAEYNRDAQNAPAVASLNLAVARGETLYLAHAGETHSYFVTPEKAEEYFEESLSGGRGLGAGRNSALQYFQVNIHPGDMVILCAQPPVGFSTQALAGQRHTLEGMRRKLISQGAFDLQAVVLQFQAGKGQVHRMRARGAVEAPEKKPETPRTPTAGTQTQNDPAPAKPMPAQPVAAQSRPLVTARRQTQPERQPAAGIYITGQTLAAIPEEAPAEEAPKKRGLAALWPFKKKAETLVEPVPSAVLPERAPASPQSHLNQIRQSAQRLVEPHQPAVNEAGRPIEHQNSPKISEPIQTPDEEEREVKPRISFRKRLAELWLMGKSARKQTAQGSADLLGRTLPGKVDSFTGLSPATMLFIALAIPLMVAAISLTIYFQTGHEEQHKAYLAQAMDYAAQADKQKDPMLKRNGLKQAVEVLNKAERFKQSPESAELRRQVQQTLDAMEGVQRLNLLPVLSSGFASTLKFSRIVTNQTDLYLLDSSQGRIFRLFMTGQGYEVDTRFNCGPGLVGSATVGPLLDMVSLPVSNGLGANVAGIDSSGNLLFCTPDKPSIVTQLMSPDNNWKKISKLTIAHGTLFVFDPAGNAIYRYYPSDTGYSDKPVFVFGTYVPNLKDVVDIAVGEGLYLLHQDGKMTTCSFNSVGADCTDPAPFGDNRPGSSKNPVILAGTKLLQLQATQPPDPSLFILDADNKSVFHMSLRLNLQRQLQPVYNPDYILDQPATAFTVSQNRVVFMAFGNQVYYASLP